MELIMSEDLSLIRISGVTIGIMGLKMVNGEVLAVGKAPSKEQLKRLLQERT